MRAAQSEGHFLSLMVYHFRWTAHEAVRLSWVRLTMLCFAVYTKLRQELCLSSSVSVQHSIQRAAVWVLEQYYSDFPVYNPALLNLPKSILTKKMSAFKVYNLGEGKMTHLTPFLCSPICIRTLPAMCLFKYQYTKCGWVNLEMTQM